MPEYHTRDVVLSNNLARPMKLSCYAFNMVFLVNHSRDILNSSYKWLSFSNSCRYIGRNPRLLFRINCLPFIRSSCMSVSGSPECGDSSSRTSTMAQSDGVVFTLALEVVVAVPASDVYRRLKLRQHLPNGTSHAPVGDDFPTEL